jgi:hypothetical protein
MSDIIDFTKEHDKRHGPDSEHVYIDGAGVKWFKFSCTYKSLTDMSFYIWATSFEDAEDRLEKIKNTAVVDGQVYAEIPE